MPRLCRKDKQLFSQLHRLRRFVTRSNFFPAEMQFSMIIIFDVSEVVLPTLSVLKPFQVEDLVRLSFRETPVYIDVDFGRKMVGLQLVLFTNLLKSNILVLNTLTFLKF